MWIGARSDCGGEGENRCACPQFCAAAPKPEPENYVRLDYAQKVMQCIICGAAVGDTTAHTRWHADTDDRHDWLRDMIDGKNYD